jgi:ABC-type Zn2+ transport system substrate-binding protein/surface adhesin
MADKTGASKGLFASIEQTGKEMKEGKKDDSKEVKYSGSDELTIKRSYTLRPSTIRKLQELKVFVYKDPNITYNEIVDEAICLLYSNKKKD